LSLGAISRHSPSLIPVGLVRTDLVEEWRIRDRTELKHGSFDGSEYAREERSGGDGNIIVDSIGMFFDERDK
jgi:hypothetical protein